MCVTKPLPSGVSIEASTAGNGVNNDYDGETRGGVYFLGSYKSDGSEVAQ